MGRQYFLADIIRPQKRITPGIRSSAANVMVVASDFIKFFHGMEPATRLRLWKAFQRWKINNSVQDYARFQESRLKLRDDALAKVDVWESPFVNAKKGENYQISFRLPDCIMRYRFMHLEKAGLTQFIDAADPLNCVIRGVPQEAGNFEITLVYVWHDWVGECDHLARKFRLVVNPDPRDLWEDKPCDPALEYLRPDVDFATLSEPPVEMWAASRRGRSHAHAGKPRDDAFALGSSAGWKIMAVADGAGSAEFSRKGAEIACETAVEASEAKLAQAGALEALFMEIEPDSPPATWQSQAKKLAYAVLPAAAFESSKAIRAEAERMGRESRAYATTLLLAMVKKFQAGWIVLSFQVGDGAMALFSEKGPELLAEPDEGEYGGQTRFITMNDIYDPSGLMRRLRIDLVPDLRGLILMTDGISDARFITLEGLRDAKLWLELWQELLPLAKGARPEAELLEWLNFWSKGNHDDRTIALLAVESGNGH